MHIQQTATCYMHVNHVFIIGCTNIVSHEKWLAVFQRDIEYICKWRDFTTLSFFLNYNNNSIFIFQKLLMVLSLSVYILNLKVCKYIERWDLKSCDCVLDTHKHKEIFVPAISFLDGKVTADGHDVALSARLTSCDVSGVTVTPPFRSVTVVTTSRSLLGHNWKFDQPFCNRSVAKFIDILCIVELIIHKWLSTLSHHAHVL